MMDFFNVSIFDISINLFKSKGKGYYLDSKDMAIYNKDEIIDKRLDLKSKSPLGLTWGYNGSGVEQSAIAILADFTKDDKFALEYYIDFKKDVLYELKYSKNHLIKYSEIQNWVDLKKLSHNE